MTKVKTLAAVVLGIAQDDLPSTHCDALGVANKDIDTEFKLLDDETQSVL